MLLALMLAGGFAATATTAAMAASGPWADSDHVRVRLISATTGVGMQESLTLGLEFQMQAGWKIYWRSPGDAGLPPRADWRASQNVAAVDMAWPAPRRFSVAGLETLGYDDSVILPLDVRPQNPGEPLRLAGVVDYLACAEICIPLQATPVINLPAGPADGAGFAHPIDRYRALVPSRDDVAGMGIVDVRMSAGTGSLPEGDGGTGDGADGMIPLRVLARADPPLGKGADLFVEGPPGSYFTAPEGPFAAEDGHSVLSLQAGGIAAADLAGQRLIFTLTDGDRAIERHLPVGPVMPEASATASAQGGTAQMASTSLMAMIGAALLGGLILNLMPCVLPVLALKLLSLLSAGGQTRGRIRRGFLASSAGIVSAFLLLGGVMAALKIAGLQIGWGIQFQQPVFLAFMVAVLALFAGNLLGLFSFRLPGFLMRAGHAGRADEGGLIGNFLAGAYATLLATPCSAPFVGVAVGFAFAQATTEILLIFAALGTGLALPWLAVAIMPGLAAYLPRPGPWMNHLRRILALALIGTALWLLFVLAASIGWQGAAVVGGLATLAGAAPGLRMFGTRAAVALCLILLPAASLAPLMLARIGVDNPANPVAAPSDTQRGTGEEIAWQPFDEAAIPAHVAAGRQVFVDVTADWCLTCQWNKRTVLTRTPVSDWLNGIGMVAMQADWTRPDPRIADYLARNGRFGIPFNMLYGPGAPGGIALPELLSENSLRNAATRARGEHVPGTLASKQTPTQFGSRDDEHQSR